MKTRTKVVIDEWLGRILVYFLNLLARFLGNVLRIDHSFDRVPKRIVVCKFLGMGSIIQATPLLRTLRQNYPNARICFVTSKANAALIEAIPIVDESKTIDDRNFFSLVSTTWSLLIYFWRTRVDWYIDLETYSYYSTAIATMSCARNRLGFYRVERNIRLGVHTHMMFFNPRASIAHAYLQMAKLAGCTEIIDDLYPFRVSEADRNSCRKKLEKIYSGTINKYVVINPNASDLRIERRWPFKNVVQLLEKLSAGFPDCLFLMIGSGYEMDWVQIIHENIAEPSKSRVMNTAGQFTLAELFALIDGAELVITNDTGPMHISFALKKQTVSLFGPASPVQYGQNSFAYGLYANVYCSPCVHDFLTPPCNGDNQCMKRISTEAVTELCIKLLKGEKILPGQFLSKEMQFTKIESTVSLGIVERP